MHVLHVTRDPDVGRGQGLMVLDVEADADLTGCPDCGVVAVGHGRHVQALHDTPCFGTPVRVRWRKRIWRCPEPSCRRGTWTPGARLRAAAGQAHQPGGEVGRQPAAARRHHGVGDRAAARGELAHLLERGQEACRGLDRHQEARIGGKAIGMDEHIWRPSRISSADKAVTVMVDLTRGPDRRLCARLLDAVQGRSGTGYADWLKEQGGEVTVSVEYAALDPFRGYRNAIRDELPDTVAVLDAFHVAKLAGNALDEVRRRVQQATLGRRGHKDDPLYRIRRTLLTPVEHLTDRQRARLDK